MDNIVDYVALGTLIELTLRYASLTLHLLPKAELRPNGPVRFIRFILLFGNVYANDYSSKGAPATDLEVHAQVLSRVGDALVVRHCAGRRLVQASRQHTVNTSREATGG